MTNYSPKTIGDILKEHIAKEHPISAWMEVGLYCLWWGAA